MKIIKITFLAFGLFILSGCNNNKFFELTNPVENRIELSVQNLDDAVGGAYYALTGNGGNGSIIENFNAFASAIGDEGNFSPLAGNDPNILDFYNRNNVNESSWLNNAYAAAYQVILSSNSIFQAINNGTVTQLPNNNQVSRIQGEAHFLRAYAYWNLAKIFCPAFEASGTNDKRVLPLRTEFLKGITDAINAPPATTKEIYDLVVSDLRKAKELLPLDGAGQFPSYQIGRVNRFAASFLLARVLFQMGDFNGAEAECDAVINSNRYNLSEEPIRAWNQAFEINAREVIWYYALGNGARSNGLGGTTSSWKVPRRFSFFNFTVGNFDGGVNPNQRTLSTSYSFLRSAGWVNPDTTLTAEAQADRRYTQLFRRIPAGQDPTFRNIRTTNTWNDRYFRSTAQRGVTSIPLFRLPEMLLTRAIIRFNKNNATGALEDVNTVRRRAGVNPLTALTAADIHRERMVELAFEGDRVYYLQALRLPIPNGDRNTSTIPFNSTSLVWALPLREGELNQGK